MTTIERFEKLYRDGSPALKQRLDDILVGATIAMEKRNGRIHRDSKSPADLPGDRKVDQKEGR